MSAGHELVVHHIGGRSGSRDFPVLDKFEKDILNVLYDADSSCVAEAESAWQASKSKTIVLPYCILDDAKKVNFHLNYDPCTSSVYPFNERYADYYYPYKNAGFDYLFSETVRAEKVFAIETRTLDDITATEKIPAPDFLSVDTQGSELNILKGASRCLKDDILALAVEVEFHPIYLGQPLFGEVCQHLAALGFDLVDFRSNERYPLRGKFGFRGRGVLTDGEAVFLRNPASIKGDALRLNKLAFLATVFSRFEIAQLCFAQPGYKPLPTADTNYLRFTARLRHAVEALPQRHVRSFAQVFPTYAASAKRFAPPSKPLLPNSFRSSIIQSLRRVAAARWVFHTLGDARRGLKSLAATGREIRKELNLWCRWQTGIGLSPVERLFAEFGMHAQFKICLKNRLIDSQHQNAVPEAVPLVRTGVSLN